jgi:hypothetical protein
MDNHRSLSPISDTPIRKVGSQCGIVEASAPRDPVLENLTRVFEKMGRRALNAGADDRRLIFQGAGLDFANRKVKVAFLPDLTSRRQRTPGG